MAKNITIREGDTAKQFTAKKLKMNLVGGGTANFVPEDEAVDYVDLKDHEFKANGTFNPSDFNCDGFGQVKVNVPANVKEKTITKNGVFNAVDDNCLGYSKVTVNVPGGGGGGPYTVKFFGDDYETVLKTEANVPYGGSASCTELDGTVLNGLYFKGWNPSPTNVKDNLNCYPVRGDYQIDPNEIQDDWATICADRGAHYSLGSYKALVVDIPAYNLDFDFNVWNGSEYVSKHAKTINVGIVSVALHMVKVAESEDNSVSTWISTGAVNFGRALIDYTVSVGALGLKDSNDNLYRADWGDSAIRRYLNSYFLQNLPTSLRDTIAQVNKSYLGFSPMPCIESLVPSQVNKESLDKIWIPSKKELQSKITGYTDSSFCGYEINGIDYSAVYNPTLSGSSSGYSLLRSSGHNSYNDKLSAICIAEYPGGGGYGDMTFGDQYSNTTSMFGFCL